MKTKKLKTNSTVESNTSEIFSLDLTDAILPNNWPDSVPLILKIQNGQYEKNFDIISKGESWHNELIEFVQTQNKRLYSAIQSEIDIPVGVNINSLPIGSTILDVNGKILHQGKSKKQCLENKNLENAKIKNLTLDFPYVKPSFLEDFKDTLDSFKQRKKNISNGTHAYNTFSDLLLAGGGSTYHFDGKTAMLGAYNSVIDYPVLDCVLKLFEREELTLLNDTLSTSPFKNLTPIHNLIQKHIQRKLDIPLVPLIVNTELKINNIQRKNKI